MHTHTHILRVADDNNYCYEGEDIYENDRVVHPLVYLCRSFLTVTRKRLRRDSNLTNRDGGREGEHFKSCRPVGRSCMRACFSASEP